MRDMRDGGPRALGLRPGVPPFILGFLAAALQIYLLREFGSAFYGNELTFGLVLGSWLFWGAVGSLIKPRAERGAGRGSGLIRLYGLALVLFFAGLAVLRFSHNLMGLLPAELTGLGPALGFASALSLFPSVLLGYGFTLNARLLGGDVATVYVFESAGAAVAGLVVHFLLIPWLSNWQGAAAAGAAAGLLVLFAMKPVGGRSIWAAALVLAAGLAVLDVPSQKAAWKPLSLIEAVDTPYGKLQVIRNKEQVTLFDNGVAVLTYPDTGAAEESVHFALLQREGPRTVLLIGGGASGGAAEALKHPDVRVDCVELDPKVIRLARKYLAGPDRAVLDDPRVRIHYRDGRTFLARTAGRYHAVLLNLPEPSTAQLNRYYTREFFLEVRTKLAPGGVFSLVVPSAENYISAPLAQFLSSLAATLRGVFPVVLAVPGGNCVFLASDSLMTVDPGRLSAAVERLGLDLRYVSPGMLPARLDPARVAYLTEKISAPDAKINLDLVPISYFFHAVLWAGQFRGLEARILGAAGRIGPVWILDVPLAVFAFMLVFLGLFRRRSSVRFLVPVAVMGFTSIAVELAVYIVYQARFGYAYGKIPLLLALFMTGLVLGAFAARSRKRFGGLDLALVQGAFMLLLLLAYRTLTRAGAAIVPLALLIGFGGLAGYLFISANRPLYRETAHPGLGYGVDLLASFAGVILSSGLIIPLFGIPALVLRLAILNALCFLYLLLSPHSA